MDHNTSSSRKGIGFPVSRLSDYRKAVDDIFLFGNRIGVSQLQLENTPLGTRFDSLKSKIQNLLREYSQSPVVNCALIGKFNSGKSMFINSFLSLPDDIAPSKARPTTHGLTKFIYGPTLVIRTISAGDDGADARGEDREISLKTYQEDIRNKNLTGRHYIVETPEVQKELAFIDTPGFSAFPPEKKDEELIEEAAKIADMILLLVDEGGSLTQDYLSWIQRLQETSGLSEKAVYIILTHGDKKGKTDRDAVLEVIKKQCVDRKYRFVKDFFQYSSKIERAKKEDQDSLEKQKNNIKEAIEREKAAILKRKPTLDTILPPNDPVLQEIRSFDRVIGNFACVGNAIKLQFNKDKDEIIKKYNLPFRELPEVFQNFCYQKICSMKDDDIVHLEWYCIHKNEVSVRYGMVQLSKAEKEQLKGFLKKKASIPSLDCLPEDAIYEVYSSVTKKIIKDHDPGELRIWGYYPSHGQQQELIKTIKTAFQSQALDEFEAAIGKRINAQMKAEITKIHSGKTQLSTEWEKLVANYNTIMEEITL